MKKRGRNHKIIGLAIASSLIILILSILLPPSIAVELSLGDFRNPNGDLNPDQIRENDWVNFSNATITIQGIERIPFTELNFTIFKDLAEDDPEHKSVQFNVSGGIQSGDTEYFKVNLTSHTLCQLETFFTPGAGYDFDYGDRWPGEEGFGYGYGDVSGDEITLKYRIQYKANGPGSDYYGKLYGTATLGSYSVIYASSASETFHVYQPSQGTHASSTTKVLALVTTQETLTIIEESLNIQLDTPFYAKDTDGDNLVDEFTDPNGILIPIRSLREGSKVLFLLSTDNDGKPDLLWNSADDTVLIILNVSGSIEETKIDTATETITVLINVEKDGWIYIEVEDQYSDYPEYSINIQTPAGRTIDPEYIWRENGKIYFLDDPATQYQIIYNYDILSPIFSPADGTEFSNTKPTISITYFEEISVVTATLNGADIRGMLTTTDLKSYTFKPTYTIGSGIYELTITAEDKNGNTRTSTATYVNNLPFSSQTEEFPWMMVAILAIILIIAIIIIILRFFVLY